MQDTDLSLNFYNCDLADILDLKVWLAISEKESGVIHLEYEEDNYYENFA